MDFIRKEMGRSPLTKEERKARPQGKGVKEGEWMNYSLIAT